MRSIRTLIACAAGLWFAAPTFAGGLVLDTEVVVSGLTRPNYVTHAPGDFENLYILEQAGQVLKYNLTTDTLTTFMDINTLVDTGFNEQGLLGLAFHPDFANNRRFYLNYTATSPNNDTVIAEYTADAGFASANPATEVRLLVIDQDNLNHNAGWIDFGPDGYLYIPMGDGGGARDPNNRAQTPTNLLGSILRIDVDGNNSSNGLYGIPADNPFVGSPGTAAPETWAYGLRNPFRNSFDRETGDFWIADVGQDAREEVNFQPASSTGGENYGWRCREGDIATPNVFPTCNPQPRVEPVYVYPHVSSPFRCSVIGGYVYRGCAIPELTGTYFCNEYCSGEVWSMKLNGTQDGVVDVQEISSQINAVNVVSWGEDAYGELYVVDQGTDTISRVIAASGATLTDCNENGIQDACEILDGSEADVDENGIPDSCEIVDCDGDANADGAVDVNDISYVLFRLGNQGIPSTVEGDVNCNGIVDVNDISYVLFRLGACDPAPACP